MEKVDRAIETLAGKITQAIKSEDAVRLSQSVLNMAHTKAKLVEIEQGTPKPTRSKS